MTNVAAAATLGHMPPFVSASAVVVDGESILAVEDPIRNELVLPGGHLKWRETPRDAVVREVKEETGLLVDPRDVIAVLAGTQWTGEPGIVRVIFTASVSGGTLVPSREGNPVWAPLIEFAGTNGRDGPILRWWLDRGKSREVLT